MLTDPGRVCHRVKEEKTLPLELDLSLDPCSSIITSVYLVKLLYAYELWFPKSENLLNPTLVKQVLE